MTLVGGPLFAQYRAGKRSYLTCTHIIDGCRDMHACVHAGAHVQRDRRQADEPTGAGGNSSSSNGFFA